GFLRLKPSVLGLPAFFFFPLVEALELGRPTAQLLLGTQARLFGALLRFFLGATNVRQKFLPDLFLGDGFRVGILRIDRFGVPPFLFKDFLELLGLLFFLVERSERFEYGR